MRLQSHATPTNATPQQRYAALHRAIERGLVSDAVWKDLAEASLELGHLDEAIGCAARVRNDALRLALESRLARRMAASNASPAGAPAASDAGTANATGRRSGNRVLEVAEEEAGLRGHLVDAFQFLFHQHMPWLCLLTMLAFPLVIGLGGFLTSGTSAVALAAISALPGICVLAVISAMGRRILIEGSKGVVDAPEFPEFRVLARDAVRFVGDALIVGLAIAWPIALAIALELSWLGVLPCALGLMLIAPIMFCLRQLRGGSASLSPLLILTAVWRGRSNYAAVAAVCWAMMVPLAAVVWYVAGQPFWLQIAAVGPTAVLPVFLASRLLGTWIDANYRQLGPLLGPKRDVDKTSERGAAAAQARMGADRTATDRKPAADEPARASQASARKKQPRRAAPPTPPAHAIEGNRPRGPRLEDTPDLSQLPGAVAVSGRDRARLGAAAKR